MLNQTDIWIGLENKSGASRSDPKADWEWLDGSPYIFMAWENSEPGQGKRYVRLKYGKWFANIQESYYSHFLCQKG